MQTTQDQLLLSHPDFLKRLEMLYLLARKVVGGDLKADRRSNRKGSGILFADYAEYSLGDDYRSIDWNIYARMESLVVKLFEVEEDTAISILVDTSRSMSPPKALHARKLAAALGYIALANADRLTLYGFGDAIDPILQTCHGKGKLLPMLHALGHAPTTGAASRFNAAMRTFASRHKRRGIAVVISDFLFPDGYSDGLKRLQFAKQDIFCIQVLDPAEMTCANRGDVDLHCIETGQTRRITVTPQDVRRFEQAFRDWNAALAAECIRRKVGLVSTTIDIPFEDIIQHILRRGGLVA